MNIGNGRAKIGRPYKEVTDGPMTSITFKVDAETLAALNELADIDELVRGLPRNSRRSTLLRRIILDAHAKRRSSKER